MTDDAATLLCTGDIHLGRHPTRIPGDRDGPQFSPRTVWASIVDHAVAEGIDAVVVTGDVVDLENRYFEAYGAFEAGSDTLAAAGIPLIVVGGNHDYDTLPRMVKDLDHPTTHLLGPDGDWERYTLEIDDEEVLHLDGWSFTDEHVHDSPLDDYDLEPSTELPTIGVLHCDLGTPDSEYAPVTESELLSTDADAWLLGHIHRPGIERDSDPLVLYPGSPQPLDPGEPGSHGPWTIEVERTGHVEANQVPMATVRYDELEIDASGARDAKDVPPLVSGQLKERFEDEIDAQHLQLLLPRVRLVGRCEAHSEIIQDRESLLDQLQFPIRSVPAEVETLEVDTKPAVDLEDLADGESPVAWIADLLLALENGEIGEEHEPLIEACTEAMEEAHAAPTFNPLRRGRDFDPPDRDTAVETLTQQARVLLDTLLDQKEEIA